MDIQELKNRIKSKDLCGWYILTGEEDYLKKYYLEQIRGAVLTDDAFDVFNHAVFNAQEIDFSALKEALSSPPMMSDLKLIEWKYADLDALKAQEQRMLKELTEIKADYPYSVFVITTTADGFDIGRPGRPSELAKALSKGFDIITFDRSTDGQLMTWIKKHFEADGVTIDAPTASALIFRVGHSMQLLNNEILKISAYVKAAGRAAVTAEDIEFVCSVNIEAGAFALGDAIIAKNAKAAFIALDDLKSKRTDPNMMISMLQKVYCDLISVSLLMKEGMSEADIAKTLGFHPYRVKLYMTSCKKTGTEKLSAALSELQRIDAASKKNGGISGYTAIEIFITQNL